MKILESVSTYDRHDCTSCGYDIDIRDDGKMRITSHSNWQGSIDGTVWMVETPAAVAAAIGRTDDDEPDTETSVMTWLESQDRNDWRMIRRGSVR